MPTMAGVSAYGQPVKSAAELQKMYQQYSAGAPAQQAAQAPPSVSRANTRPAPAPVAPQASAPTTIQRPGTRLLSETHAWSARSFWYYRRSS
jgi:hypothetical protein